MFCSERSSSVVEDKMGLMEECTGQNLTCFLVASAVLLTLWSWTKKSRDLPPGPRLIPVVGNLLSLRGDVRKIFQEMRRKYGDVFSLYLGSKLVIVFNGYQTLTEAFVKNGDVFSDRPKGFFYERFTKGLGIIAGSGRIWKKQRTFSLNTLRYLGFAKNKMERRIQEEMTSCLDRMEVTKGKPFDSTNIISAAVCNIICSLIFGKRFEHNDPEYVHYIESNSMFLKLTGGTSLVHFFPALQHLPWDPCNFKHLYTCNIEIKEFVDKIIEQHKKEFDGINVEDFIDAYLLEMEKEKKTESDTTFSDDLLCSILRELFVAGTETVSTTLRWALLFMALNPGEQIKVQAEIDDVIGDTRLPEMADRKFLPYTEATIFEIQRLADVVPFSVPHSVANDTKFSGYLIPKEAWLFPNISSVLADTSLWADPDIFRPSRFLDSDGNINRDLTVPVIPFFMGKRICLGESLARMELFLGLTCMLQRFSFRLPEDEARPSLQGILGVTRTPEAYKISAVKRSPCRVVIVA